MQDFAFDFTRASTIIEPGAFKDISFESPTPGKINVLLKAVEALYQEALAPPSNATGTDNNDGVLTTNIALPLPSKINYLPINLNPSPDIGPDTNIKLKKSVADQANFFGDELNFDGGIGPIDVPPIRDINPQFFTVEVIDGGGNVKTSGAYVDFLTTVYTVPEPSGPIAASPIGFRTKWKIRLTNNSDIRANVDLTIKYSGHRPILTKEINLDFLNEKLDLIFNDQQPFQISFYNENVQVTQIINNQTVTVEVPHTFVSLNIKEEWKELYPNLAQIIFKKLFNISSGRKDLGYKIFRNNFSTYQITVKATIHDGSLAFKVKLAFPYNATSIDVLDWLGSQDWVGPIASLIDVFTDEIVTIKDFNLEAFLVLRTARINQWINPPNFEIIVNPKVDTSYGQSIDQVIQNVIRFFADSIDLFGKADTFQEAAKTLLGWLIGDRDRQFAGSNEGLDIKYVGDAPKTNLGMNANMDDFLPSMTTKPLEPGNLSKIDHIVVLMMENRSFDHMLGYLSLPTSAENGLIGRGRMDVDGLTGTETNPLNANRNAFQSIFPLSRPMTEIPVFDGYKRGTKFIFDPGHSYSSTKQQRANQGGLGKNEGFLINFANKLGGIKPQLEPNDQIIFRKEIMGYHPAEHVPVYDYLAGEFGICDRWFSALPTSTWPNRFVTLTGRLAPGANGLPDLGNPQLSTFDPLEVPTIFDHLSTQNVSWKYFEHDFCFLRVFSKYTMDTTNIVSMNDPENGFYALAQRGDLPSVVFIEPDLTNIPPSTDDHPPTDIQNGQIFIQHIYDALRNSPNWSKTLFLITYDEHGGFYDHVYPESMTLFSSDNPEAGGFVPLAYKPGVGRPFIDYQPQPIDFYGMRVPTFVISPYVPKATVSSTVFDHTSILKTIIRRFLSETPPNMGARVALANDVGEMLTQNQPRSINVSPEFELNPNLMYDPAFLTKPEKDDFHAFMTALKGRLQYKKGINLLARKRSK